MNLSYLNNKSWEMITREERYYCAELFFFFKNNIDLFIELIVKKTGVISESEKKYNWELSFEVCFYRDYIYSNKKKLNTKGIFDRYSRKRTFDLCLFSEQKIVIIEAKVQQKFDSKQNAEFEKDIVDVIRLIGEAGHTAPKVEIIGLASSIYFKNVEKYGEGISDLFKGRIIEWKDIYELNKIEIFRQADEFYKL